MNKKNVCKKNEILKYITIKIKLKINALYILQSLLMTIKFFSKLYVQ